jgi:hypothetical protein
VEVRLVSGRLVPGWRGGQQRLMSAQIFTLGPIPSTVWINLEIRNATTTVDLHEGC